MKYVIILFNIFFIISCTRTALNTGKSSLRFDFSKVQYKNSVLTNNQFPDSSEICYGVNITSNDLPIKEVNCGPKLGLTAGFVPSGSEVSLEVPNGDNRNIELYMYLPTNGEACPSTENSKIDPSLLFKVSNKTNVSMNSSELYIDMPVEFPGFDHSVYDDLNLPISCLENNVPVQPTNPDAPQIITSNLNMTNITSSGIDETLTLSVLVKSVYTPNWLNFNHDGPNGNISGGGTGQMFYTCTTSNSTNSNHICYGYNESYYYTTKSIQISQWAQNGNYTIDFSVQDTMFYTSSPSLVTYSISNHPVVNPPNIINVLITPDAGLTSGAGGYVYLDFLVESTVQPTTLMKSLQRPDLTYIYGGGNVVTWTNCSSFASSPSHICYNHPTDHWFYSISDFFSIWAQNGVYTYSDIQVQNIALLNSSYYGSSPNFSISGNTPAITPTINFIDRFYAFDDSSINNGIPYYDNSCIRVSSGTNLSLGFRVNANTNAPINFINYSLNSPSTSILGGGNGVGSNNVASNTYEASYEYMIMNISNYERGYYNWNNLSVANEGGNGSAQEGPFYIDIQDSCLTNYLPVISSNSYSTCAITNTSDLKCWGSNSGNVLDHGSTTVTRKQPTIVQGDFNFSTVSLGLYHTCAVKITGELNCWGDNSFGQLGNNSTAFSSKPVIADSSVTYSKVAAGTTHTCGITTSGVLKCWGQNNYGQLGDGTTTQKLNPTIIDSGINYQEVAVGYNYSCGITTSGSLKCWGQNSNGQLGDGTLTQKTTPTVIDSGTFYSRISTGYNTSCGITTSGVLKCWGFNNYGQIGDNTTTQKSTPTLIDSGVVYQEVSITQGHACGITNANLLKCWGNNANGTLGNGSNTNSSIPISIGSGFAKVSTGYNHTCAIQTSGFANCWGNNSSNQLGDGTSTSSPSPVVIDQ